MTKAKKPAPGPNDENPEGALSLSDRILQDFWPDAVRLALLSDGAPERCKRRACRVSQTCRLRYKVSTPLDCGGGPVSDEVIVRACVAVQFGLEVAVVLTGIRHLIAAETPVLKNAR